MLRSILLAAWFCLATVSLCAQKIEWNNSFGQQGFATFAGDVPGNVDAETANSIVRLADGKTLVYVQKQFSFLCRLLPNGNPDSSYGTNGSLSPYSFAGARLHQQANGNILLAGIDLKTKAGLGIARLLPDGTPDPAYPGYISLKTSYPFHYGSNVVSILPQPGNRLVVAVFSHALGHDSSRLLLYRIMSNGQADPSFGTNGEVIVPLPQFTRLAGVALSGNRILAAYIDLENNRNIQIKAINSQGQPDRLFGNSRGTVEIKFEPESGMAGITTLADGRILIGGNDNFSPYPYVVYRLLPNGQPDNRFGSGGKRSYVLNMRTLEYSLRTMIIDAKQGLLVVGQDRNHEFSITAVRIDSNGTRDRSWGNNGTSRIPVGSSSYQLHDLHVAADSSLQVSGYTFGSGHDYFVGRFKPGGQPDASFGIAGFHRDFIPAIRANFGKSILKVNGSMVLAYTPNTNKPSGLLYLQPNGTPQAEFGNNGFLAGAAQGFFDTMANRKIIQAQNNWHPTLGATIVLNKYLPNGQPDAGFGISGKKQMVVKPDFSLYHIWSLPGDKLLIAGTFNDDNLYNSTLLACLDADGNIDPGFGDGGFQVFNGGDWFITHSITKLSDGSFLVGGNKYNDFGVEVYAICKLKADGTRDFQFGSNGFIVDEWEMGGTPTSIMPQPGGNFVVRMELDATTDFVRRSYLARFDAMGQRITDFALAQYRPEEVFAHHVLEDGRILELSYSPSSESEIRVASYSPNGVSTTDFGVNGVVILPLPYACNFTGTNYQNGLLVLSGTQITPNLTNAVIAKLQVANNQLVVQSLTLVNATTDRDIQPLTSGTNFNLANVKGRSNNIRANVSDPAIKSIVMELSGRQTHKQIESIPAYTLFGNTGNDYGNWTPAPGNYTLTATPYTGTKGTGTAGTPLTISFSISDDLTLIGLELVNARTNTSIQFLHNGATIDLAQTPDINVVALPGEGLTQSVMFGVNSNTKYKLENSAPFALASDNKGDYSRWNVKPGTYTITATPYSETRARGKAGDAASVTITIINSAAKTAIATNSQAPQLDEDASMQAGIYPNPTNGAATLRFAIPQGSFISIDLLDAAGVVNQRLYNGKATGGVQQIQLQMERLKAGVYFARIMTTGGKWQVVQILKQ